MSPHLLSMTIPLIKAQDGFIGDLKCLLIIQMDLPME